MRGSNQQRWRGKSEWQQQRKAEARCKTTDHPKGAFAAFLAASCNSNSHSQHDVSGAMESAHCGLHDTPTLDTRTPTDARAGSPRRSSAFAGSGAAAWCALTSSARTTAVPAVCSADTLHARQQTSGITAPVFNSVAACAASARAAGRGRDRADSATAARLSSMQHVR